MEFLNIGGFSITISQRARAGEFGAVYKGKNNLSKRDVAIKAQTHMTEKDEKILDKIKNNKQEYIIKVFAFELQKLTYYTIMEYGQQINFLKIKNPKHTCIQMAKAVQELHKLEFFHRDLKPQNFVICQDGKVKLIDLGLAEQITK